MKNRIWALALALVLALGCMSAFSASADAADLPVVELVYWNGGNAGQKDAAEVEAYINELTMEKLNCTVKWVNVAFGEYYEKWSKALAAQEQMDICWTGWVHNIQNEVTKGALLPLDDYAELAPNLFASISSDAIDLHRSSDGKLYQFPAWQGLVGGRHHITFAQEKMDVVLAADPNWMTDSQQILYDTWKLGAAEKTAFLDKLTEMFAILKDADELGYGMPGASALMDWYMLDATASVYTNCFVEYGDDEFKVKYRYTDDRFTTLTKYVAEWFDAGYIRQDIASLEKLDQGNASAEGTTPDDVYIIVSFHNAFTDSAYFKETGSIVFPYVSLFTRTPQDLVFGNGSATGMSLPFTGKNPDRAMMFLDLLYTEEGQEIYNAYSYGIEGKHYTWNEDHTEITTLGGVGQATEDWAYGQRPWTLGTLMMSYNTPQYPHDYYIDLKTAEETAMVEPTMAFKFDNMMVEIEQANMKAVEDEYKDMFARGYLGAEWESKYEEFIAKMESAGLQTYLDEVQTQLDAYVAERGSKWNWD